MPDKYARSAWVNHIWSSRLASSRAECMDNSGTPTSTVGMPRRVAEMGPMVEPQGTALWPTKVWEGTPAAAQARRHIASVTASEA